MSFFNIEMFTKKYDSGPLGSLDFFFILDFILNYLYIIILYFIIYAIYKNFNVILININIF